MISYILEFLFIIKYYIKSSSLKLEFEPSIINNLPLLKKNFNETNIIKYLLHNDLQTTLYIGVPIQKVNTFIKLDEESFLFTDKFKNLYNNNFKYNSTLSNTFFNTSPIIFSYNEYLQMENAIDNFTFEFNNNQKICKKLNFITSDVNNSTLVNIIIGLSLPDSGIVNFHPKFLNELKDNKIINNYKFHINFINQNKGYIIFGKYQHEIDNKNYNVNLLKTVQAQSYLDHNTGIKSLTWDIPIKSIYLINNNLKTESIDKYRNDIQISLNYNFGLIIGIQKYKFYLEEYYFKDFIKNKVCKEIIIDKNLLNELTDFIIFICDSKNYNDLKKNFLSINFYSSSFNYNFTLNFDDVFLQINSTLIFLIIFEKELVYNTNYHRWIMGYPFLYKYNKFNFDYDNKLIGFYNDDINNDKILKNKKFIKNNNKYPLILFGILFIILLYVIYKFKNFVKNKNFDYSIKKDNTLLPKSMDWFDIKNYNELDEYL